MIHRPEFFDLQWHVATRAAALAGVPLADALMDYTNLYARFGLGRDFDRAAPPWLDFLDGLRRSAAPREWVYAFYRSRLPDPGAPGTVASVGCFSYARLGEGRVRLHFHDSEAAAVSPLAAHRQAVRRDELRRLARQIRRDEGEEALVIGRSWLYNLPAYRRLFPSSYLASAAVAAPRFNGMPLWGQLIDRQGFVRPAAADLLRQRLSSLTSIDGLASCFAFRVLDLEGAASLFD
ncbi:MAG: hypothetical protein ABI641_02855 [Caldimonas sp.]